MARESVRRWAASGVVAGITAGLAVTAFGPAWSSSPAASSATSSATTTAATSASAKPSQPRYHRHGENQHGPVPMTSQRLNGCTVRFVGEVGKPTVHGNPGHSCVGVSGVDVSDAGDLVIRTDSSKPVFAHMVSADETLAVRGITVGSTARKGAISYRFHDHELGRALRLNQPQDWARIESKVSNVWLGWAELSWTPPYTETPRRSGTGIGG